MPQPCSLGNFGRFANLPFRLFEFRLFEICFVFRVSYFEFEPSQRPRIMQLHLELPQESTRNWRLAAEYSRLGYIGRVWMLLRNGADPDAKAADGTTAQSILDGIDDPDALAAKALLAVARHNLEALKEGHVPWR